MARHGPYAHSTLGKLHHIAHAAVDHHSRPAIALCEQSEVATHQSAAIAAAAIDDEDAARPGCLEDLAHMRVVLETLQGDHRATHRRLTSVILENRRQNAQGARREKTLVGITEIRSWSWRGGRRTGCAIGWCFTHDAH